VARRAYACRGLGAYSGVVALVASTAEGGSRGGGKTGAGGTGKSAFGLECHKVKYTGLKPEIKGLVGCSRARERMSKYIQIKVRIQRGLELRLARQQRCSRK